MSNISKNNSNNTPGEAAILAVTGGSGGSAQERLAQLLELKLGKEFAQEQEEALRLQNFKDAQIAAIRKQMAEKAEAQARCPHMKPNFRPATGGQKDHKGVLHSICQYCQKEWIGDELPYHLRIPGEMIGGPQ